MIDAVAVGDRRSRDSGRRVERRGRRALGGGDRARARPDRPSRGNAGIAGSGTPFLEEAPVDEWWHVFEVNVLGPYLCCRTVRPRMVERGGGRIVNMGSGGSYLPITNPHGCPRDAVRGQQGGARPLLARRSPGSPRLGRHSRVPDQSRPRPNGDDGAVGRRRALDPARARASARPRPRLRPRRRARRPLPARRARRHRGPDRPVPTRWSRTT